MVAADEDEPPAETNEDEELAKKLARLTDEQRLLYQNQLENVTELVGEISRSYRLHLADTLAKELPVNELSQEIKELNRRERQDAYWREQNSERDRSQQAKPLREEQLKPEQDAARQHAPTRDAPPLMPEVTTRPQPRDFEELQRTHHEVAEQMRANTQHAAAPSPMQATQTLPGALPIEQLQTMLEHYSAVRRDQNLPHGYAEMQEQAKLSGAQFTDRQALDQRQVPAPNTQERELRLLLDYQHFAENAGTQAKWLALDLKTQRSAESEHYLKESRHAFQTARLIHEQRQKLGHAPDHAHDRGQGRAPEHLHPNQSEFEQASREGREVNSDRANLTSEARPATERHDRSDSGRAPATAAKEQGPQQGKNDTGRGGGRGR